jgi:opacity protein-like surface antigen
MGTRTRIAAALLGALLAAPAARAQDYSGAVGYGGGGIWFGDFNEQGPSLALQSGWLATVHAEQYLGRGRIGARLGAAFTQRPFDAAGLARDINTWLFDGSLLLRPLPLDRRRSVVPFLSVGAGVVSYGFGEGRPVVFEESGAVYPGDTDRRLTVVGGLGVDFVPRFSLWGTPLGVRLEAADHVALESPFQTPDGDPLGPVHNVRVTLGLIGLVELP